MVSYAPQRRRIVIVSASVGAGHDGAAAELARRIDEAGTGYLADRRDFIDLLERPVGPAIRAAYKSALKLAPGVWDRALGRMNATSRFNAGRMLNPLSARKLRLVLGDDVAAVVSTYPMASQALGRLRATGRLDAPVITFLTDMSVHPLWISPGVDLHLALHPIAAGQASALDAGDVRVVAPLIRPQFQPATSTADRIAARARFDLPASGPLALVVAGSWGVGEIEDAVRDIAATGLVTPVVACGHNSALRARVAKSGLGIPLEWVSDMPHLLIACDVVVQNAGGLTSLEALAAGVPVLTYRCLVGHGRTNADALHRSGWAPWVRAEADLPAALATALSGSATPQPFGGTDAADLVLATAGRYAVPAAVTA